jgi:chorismate mutase
MWLLLLIFGIAWLVNKVSESEPRRLELPSAEPPMRLLTSAAAHVTTLDIVPRAAHNTSLCQIGISPGHEAFTPPLPPGVLKLVFTGACALKSATYTQWYGVDACYWTGTDHNYLKRHSGLVLNGKEFWQDPLESDRAAHRYSFGYPWKGGRLGVLLKPPAHYYAFEASSGVIDLAIMWVSPLEGSGEVEKRKREEQRTQRALELAVLAHLESNFLDPEYQQNYAASHIPRILDHNKREWLEEYKEVIGDADLYALIAAEHPHVLEFLEARLEVIRIAQRLAVKPRPKPKEPELQRKETPEEWRERKLRHLRNNAEHKIAKMLERFESARRLREQAEMMGLDEEIIERLESELMGDLDDDEDEHRNGFKQV